MDDELNDFFIRRDLPVDENEETIYQEIDPDEEYEFRAEK